MIFHISLIYLKHRVQFSEKLNRSFGNQSLIYLQHTQWISIEEKL